MLHFLTTSITCALHLYYEVFNPVETVNAEHYSDQLKLKVKYSMNSDHKMCLKYATTSYLSFSLLRQLVTLCHHSFNSILSCIFLSVSVMYSALNKLSCDMLSCFNTQLDYKGLFYVSFTRMRFIKNDPFCIIEL